MSNLVTDAEAKKVIYAEAGEWVPHSSIMEWGCCDCGLVHDVEFRLNGSGQLEVRMFRNQEQTIAARTQKRSHAVTFVAEYMAEVTK